MMEDSSDKIRDPLSDVTRKERRSLLLASTIGISIGIAGIVPSKIPAFGIEFSATSQKAILGILSLVVLYFLLAFLSYASTDIAAWRRELVKSSREKIIAEDREAREGFAMREEIEEVEARILRQEKLLMTLTWYRMGLDLLFPIVLGLAAIYILVRSINMM